MFHQVHQLSKATEEKLENLRNYFKDLEKICVAYSGGVDSTLVAAIAHEQLGEKAIAITGVSESLTTKLRKEARAQAEWIGIKHLECLTDELNQPSYYQNPQNRCFSCKQELYKKLNTIIDHADGYKVIDGVNLDDLKDYRPGIDAAKKAGVRSPLAELEINKLTVRTISKAIGLPWWEKPSQPCLASRFPYGEVIDRKRLLRVEKAEEWIRGYGYKNIRVRSIGNNARIEVPKREIESLIYKIGTENINSYFVSIGFESVIVDNEGLISGKLNKNLLNN